MQRLDAEESQAVAEPKPPSEPVLFSLSTKPACQQSYVDTWSKTLAPHRRQKDKRDMLAYSTELLPS